MALDKNIKENSNKKVLTYVKIRCDSAPGHSPQYGFLNKRFGIDLHRDRSKRTYTSMIVDYNDTKQEIHKRKRH